MLIGCEFRCKAGNYAMVVTFPDEFESKIGEDLKKAGDLKDKRRGALA